MHFAAVDEAEAVNMGIAIVVPAKKILEILRSPALIQARDETARE